jgi:hypothetical protein
MITVAGKVGGGGTRVLGAVHLQSRTRFFHLPHRHGAASETNPQQFFRKRSMDERAS